MSIVGGAAVLVCALFLVLMGRWVVEARQPERMHIDLRTNAIGGGIAAGAAVRLNGVDVGRVAEVDATPGGTQQITLALDKSQVAGLTDSLRVDIAPSNLFGISDVILREERGGTLLAEGADIDLTGNGRMNDVTMGNLLRSLSDTTLTVLTPELTKTLNQFATSLDAFTPLFEVMVDVSTAVADTQRYPASFLIEQYGSFLDGAGKFSDGFVKLIDTIYKIPVLRNNREHFDVGVALVVDRLFPDLSRLLGVANNHVGDYASDLSFLLGQVAQSVPDPVQAHGDLHELLNRLESTFRPTPGGPVVGLDVVLRGVPGVAVPLLGAVPNSTAGG